MTTLVGNPGTSRTMVGYGWPWTVRPGEKIDFMVNCKSEASYRADLVRIICADDLSSHEMFKEEEVEASFNGQYPGYFQPTYLGSYVEVTPKAALDALRSFTVQAMVYPTLLLGGVRVRQGTVPVSSESPVFGDQHVVSRWDERTQRGWALLLDSKGRPMFMIGTGGRVHRVRLDRGLQQDKWFLLTGGLDAENRRLHIAAKAVGSAPGDLVAWPETCHEERYFGAELVPQEGPLRFAACTDGAGNGPRLKPAHCFNGRLDRVRLTEGLLNLQESQLLSGPTIPPSLRLRVIGFWDFSRDIERIEVTDLSPNALHGVTVNVPSRAVRGVDWDGSVNDWRIRADFYSAIHFHEDDLYDAEWKADFSYTVPQGLPSGIYAARLRQGQTEDYIPFFVVPAKRQARARVALLLPTMSYTAYTNVTGLTTLKRKRRVANHTGAATVIEEDWHPCVLQKASDAAFLLEHHRELGKGIYANHTDGTLCNCASQRHPNMTIKPKGITWTLVPDSYLTDWFEQKGVRYDVITDELLHQEGVELLADYSVVLTGTHPEYYTHRMFDAVDQYQRQGGRWMYLGGNGIYWVTSLHTQLPGVIEVRKGSEAYAGHCPRYELCHAFEGVQGGHWRDIGRAPQSLFGVGLDPYTGSGWRHGAPYRRLPDSYSSRAAFIFEGVSEEIIGGYGLFGNGAAGQEVDAISQERGTPAHVLHLARADAFEGSEGAGEHNMHGPIADMVYFETPHGGAVFSVGSMSWAGALSHNGYDNDVSRITENVLRRFMDKSPFLLDDIVVP